MATATRTTRTRRAGGRLDTSYHDQYLGRRLQKDPEFREEFERHGREIEAIDQIVNTLDELRQAWGLSKAELARRIEKNPASIRRLLTAPANPELRTVVALAEVLDAEVRIVPRRRARKKLQRLFQKTPLGV